MYYEVFKYFSILSFPIFGIIAFLIIYKTKLFTLVRTVTLSQTIFHIKDRKVLFIYKLNFFIKAILDILFTIYLYTKLDIIGFNVMFIIALLSPILFALIAIFTEDKYYKTHYLVTYTSGLLGMISACYITYILKIPIVTISTIVVILATIFVSIYYQLSNRLNFYIQFLTVSLMWILIIVLVSQIS